MPVTIRAASIADSDGIAKVHVDSWNETYTGIMPQEVLDKRNYIERATVWRSIFERADPGGFHFVVCDGSDIVGFASGGNNRDPEFSFKSEIFAIYLLKRFHGQGIGRQLFITAVTHLIGSGRSDMMLWVLEDNSTRGFYERMGGIAVGRKVKPFGGKELTEFAYAWKDLTKAGDSTKKV